MPGFWETRIRPFGPAPDGFQAIHLIHLRTGRFLVHDRETAMVWDPATGNFQSVPPPANSRLFCSGHSAMADGRILFAGGAFVDPAVNGSPAPKEAYLFDPGDQDQDPPTPPSWSQLADMQYQRFYPTCTTLGDGRVLVASGYQANPTPALFASFLELYDPADQAFETLTPEHVQERYPFMFLLPDGNLVDAGPATLTLVLEAPPGVPDWIWSEDLQQGPEAGMLAGSAVVYDAVAGKVLKSGGTQTGPQPGVVAAALFDHQAAVWWGLTANMHFGRRNHNLVVLPDQTVLAVGGNLNGNSYNAPQGNATPEPVMEAEIFDPASETWARTNVEMTDPRWYHSTAVLLPDARVLTAGGNTHPQGPYTIHSAQIFRPPYLDGDPDRASFVAPLPPSVMNYGQPYTFGYTHPSDLGISKVCLIRLASVTHSFDEDQRYVPLSFTVSEGNITLTAPANGSIAPPGYYMLFIVDVNGVPCASAAYVRVAAA